MTTYVHKTRFLLSALILYAVVPSLARAEAPDSTCATRRENLTAVRTGVGTAFVAGNAYLWHYF